ncbi:MAG: toll/interleukin-1 receptor domain-containing protein [Phycisphaerales bacterium]
MGFRRTGARLVFISHAGEDTWIARQLAAHVAQCGAQPYLDRVDNDIGLDFEERLLEVLDHADELIVLFTPWSLDRAYVWAEVGAAWIRRIPIVILLHGLSEGEFAASPKVPVFTKKRDLLSLNDVDRYFAQLRERTLARGSDA